MALRIVVADDHDIIRRGLKQLLTAHAGWEVCAEAKTGREAVTVAEQLRPDIVVMDISMPDLNGLEAARRIKKSLPRTEILILTLHFSDQLVREIVEAGVRAYIMKSDADKDLVSAVEALSNHRSFLPRGLRTCCWTDSAARMRRPIRKRCCVAGSPRASGKLFSCLPKAKAARKSRSPWVSA